MKENNPTPKSKGWKRFAGLILESLGIILSIVIAFGIENWDEEQKKTEKEVLYLQSVYTDLLKDYRELNRRISEYDKKLRATERILMELKKEQCVLSDIYETINKFLTYNFSYVPFNQTYKALESSGDIKLIKNEELKLLLFELDKSFFNTTLYGDNFLYFTNSTMWAWYLLNKIDYMESGFLQNQIQSKEEKKEFYNRVARLNKLIETYYYNMQGTHLKIK